jgi:hypothetical protein
LKCGVEEGWSRAVAPFVCEMKKYCTVEEERNILHKKKANWIGHHRSVAFSKATSSQSAI